MSEETPEPRWDIVNELYDGLDQKIHDLFMEKKITYAEIEFAMIMMKEKLLQQKIQLMHAYIQSESSDNSEEQKDNVEPKPEPKDLYK